MFNPGMANMQGMMKKVQKMQQDMLKMQEELKNRTVEATAGGTTWSMATDSWISSMVFVFSGRCGNAGRFDYYCRKRSYAQG